MKFEPYQWSYTLPAKVAAAIGGVYGLFNIYSHSGGATTLAALFGELLGAVAIFAFFAVLGVSGRNFLARKTLGIPRLSETDPDPHYSTIEAFLGGLLVGVIIYTVISILGFRMFHPTPTLGRIGFNAIIIIGASLFTGIAMMVIAFVSNLAMYLSAGMQR